jgi:hypothetical protein
MLGIGNTTILEYSKDQRYTHIRVTHSPYREHVRVEFGHRVEVEGFYPRFAPDREQQFPFSRHPSLERLCDGLGWNVALLQEFMETLPFQEVAG